MLSSLVFANQNSPQTHFLAPAAHRPPFSPPPPYTSLLLPFTFARHRNERHVTATPLIPTTYKCPLSQLLSLHILTNARGVYAESAVSFLKNYLNLAFISVVTNKLAAALLPEVEKGNEVEQDHTEGDEAREDAEPGEHERALVLAGRRRGDSKHEVESPEYFCEKLDHGAPAEMRSDGGSSVRHRSDFFFDFRDIDHDDGIPRTAIEEAAVGALAEAFLAADAQNRVNLDAPKRWTVFVRHPKHAVLDGAVFHAGRRSRAPGTALGDDGEFFRFLLAGGGDPLGAGFKLLLVGHASSHSPQNMHREVSYVKKVSTLRRVASSRSQPTTIRFSGHASAHKLHPMHSVSPVSGLLFSRGAPRYRSATIGRSSGYCSVTMFLGFCARKVTARPFKKSTWNNRSRSSRMRVSLFLPLPIVKQPLY